jgi:hypothetical protein
VSEDVEGVVRAEARVVPPAVAARLVSMRARKDAGLVGRPRPAARQPVDKMVNPALLEHEEIYFNAARLDRSLALSAKDYVRIAQPRLESISEVAAV